MQSFIKVVGECVARRLITQMELDEMEYRKLLFI